MALVGGGAERGRSPPGLDVERASAVRFATCANETSFLRLIDEGG